MSPEQKMLVKSTWTKVIPIADTAVTLFYEKLFAIDSSVRPMFQNTNMIEQRRKLVQALAMVVNGLDDLGQLVPVLERLGKNHAQYGVTNKHYDSVGAALLWTLEEGLKDAWTPAAKEAWAAAYGTIASVMLGAQQLGKTH